MQITNPELILMHSLEECLRLVLIEHKLIIFLVP